MSFGAVAADYAAGRPSYPGSAVAWLAGEAPVDVLDLGAGTGKLTEQLVAAGHRVSAVDPSEGMLDELHRRLPTVATAVGAAEAVPLPDASCDVITVAQAWHWFDPVRAPAECGRLLRPGGRLGLAWNERDESVDWVGAAWAPLHRSGRSGLALQPEGWRDAVRDNGPFGPEAAAVFDHEQVITKAAILRLARSQSDVVLMQPATREEALAEMARVLDEHPATRGSETLRLPYETRCFRWTRDG